jgi:putative membrane protein
MRFLIRLIITAAALWAAVALVNGITFTGGWISLLFVALIFGLVNAIVRPLLKLLTCPLVLLTLGLFIFVINALMLWLTSALSVSLGLGFHVAGFASAFWGALVVSIVSVLLSLFVPDGEARGE